MTEPIVFRKTFAVALVAMLQALLPPVIAALSLYVTAISYGAEFDRRYVVLGALVVALSAILLQPPRDLGSQLISRRVPLAFSVLVRWVVLFGLLLAVGYATKFSEEYSRRVMFTWALLTPALLICGVLGLHELMMRLLHDPSSARKVVFAGCNEISRTLAERLRRNPALGMKVEGFFDDRSRERLGIDGVIQLHGGLSGLAKFVRERKVDVIFIALPIRHIRRVMDLLDELRDTTASIYYVPDIFVFDLIQARTSEILGIPVVAMCETPFYGYRGVIKRLVDISISFLAIVLTAPLMLIIASMIKFTSPGPVIFKQRRYGLDGHQITVYKFRTMTVTEDGDHVQQARKGDARVTRVGKILRRYSLDELPQLINVLQGRMSLVGPRPHAVAHNEQYRKLIKGYMIRHKVLPGITGLAQISGCRGETARVEEMQARVSYDLEYLRRWSPALDFKILWLTLLRFVSDKNAY